MKYTFKDLNFPYQLNLMYKQFGLNDFEFAVLLNMYHILEKNSKLFITADVLSAFMSSDKQTIDKTLIELQDKGYIEYLDDEIEGVFTSIDKLIDKVFKKTISNIRAEEYIISSKGTTEQKHCIQVIQEAIQRDLNIHEFQKIGQFIAEGITESKIVSSVNYLQNSGDITFNKLNKYLLSLLNENKKNKANTFPNTNKNKSDNDIEFKTKLNSNEIDTSIDLSSFLNENKKTTEKEVKQEEEYTREELENFNWFDE